MFLIIQSAVHDEHSTSDVDSASDHVQVEDGCGGVECLQRSCTDVDKSVVVMQCGFAMLEAGSVSEKNVSNIIYKVCVRRALHVVRESIFL